MTDADEWRDYQQGMLEIARIDAPVLAARVPVPKGARRLLDRGRLARPVRRRDLPKASADAFHGDRPASGSGARARAGGAPRKSTTW